jgi:hypothetical protein
MKILIIILFVFGFAFNTLPQSTTKQAKIRQLLELTGSAKLGVQVAESVFKNFKAAHPEVNEQFWSQILKKINTESLIDLILPIYEKHFTEEDIDQMIVFYNSPVGKKFISCMPQITQEAMTAGMQWGQQLGEQVTRELEEMQNRRN